MKSQKMKDKVGHVAQTIKIQIVLIVLYGALAGVLTYVIADHWFLQPRNTHKPTQEEQWEKEFLEKARKCV